MLKDLRNEKSNMVQNEIKEEIEEVDNKSADDSMKILFYRHRNRYVEAAIIFLGMLQQEQS